MKRKRLKITIGYIVVTIVLFIGNGIASMFETEPDNLTSTCVEIAKIIEDNDPDEVRGLLSAAGMPSELREDNSVYFKLNEFETGIYKNGVTAFNIKDRDAAGISQDFKQYCTEHNGEYLSNGTCLIDGLVLYLNVDINENVQIVIGTEENIKNFKNND